MLEIRGAWIIVGLIGMARTWRFTLSEVGCHSKILSRRVTDTINFTF